jgi:hypothetical protein
LINSLAHKSFSELDSQLRLSRAENVWSYVSDEQIARSKAFCSRASRKAWSYSCSILIGCPKKPTNEANNATGIHISVDGYHFLATAHHVFKHYVDQRQKVDHLHFQAGDLELDARNRIVYEDSSADVAVLAINDDEVKSLGSSAPFVASETWPAAPPDVGALVAFGGYAKINRVNGESGTINSTFLPLIAYVANASTTHFSVRLNATTIAGRVSAY